MKSKTTALYQITKKWSFLNYFFYKDPFNTYFEEIEFEFINENDNKLAFSFSYVNKGSRTFLAFSQIPTFKDVNDEFMYESYFENNENSVFVSTLFSNFIENYFNNYVFLPSTFFYNKDYLFLFNEKVLLNTDEEKTYYLKYIHSKLYNKKFIHKKSNSITTEKLRKYLILKYEK